MLLRYQDRIQPCQSFLRRGLPVRTIPCQDLAGPHILLSESWLNYQTGIHYIPIKQDLTDVYDVLRFFRDGHDKMAKQIAPDGKEWSQRYWRMEDMVAYQFRYVLFALLSSLSASVILSGYSKIVVELV